MRLRLAGVVPESVVDGPGIRLVVFAQGCSHHCPGCHNPETHDPQGGYWLEATEVVAMLAASPLHDGLTISGGEPFDQAAGFAALALAVKERGFNVVSYTGYTIEQLLRQQDPERRQLLAASDLLVDGRFQQQERDLGLAFRGSRNQRLIDVAATLAQGRVVLWQELLSC